MVKCWTIMLGMWVAGCLICIGSICIWPRWSWALESPCITPGQGINFLVSNRSKDRGDMTGVVGGMLYLFWLLPCHAGRVSAVGDSQSAKSFGSDWGISICESSTWSLFCCCGSSASTPILFHLLLTKVIDVVICLASKKRSYFH